MSGVYAIILIWLTNIKGRSRFYIETVKGDRYFMKKGGHIACQQLNRHYGAFSYVKI